MNKVEVSRLEYLKNKFSNMDGLQLVIVKWIGIVIMMVINISFWAETSDDYLGKTFQISRAFGLGIIQTLLPIGIIHGQFNFKNEIKKLNIPTRIIFIPVWIALLWYSTMSMAGYTLKQVQDSKTSSIQNSKEYKTLESEKKMIESQIDTKTKLLDTENSNYALAMTSDKDSSSEDKKLRDDLNSQVKQKDSKISSLNSQITANKNSGLKETGSLITGLRKEISTLENDKKKLIESRDKLNESNNSASGIQSRIDTLSNDIGKLQTDLSNLNTKIINPDSSLKKKSAYDYAFGSNAEIATKGFYWLFEAVFLLVCIISRPKQEITKVKYYKSEVFIDNENYINSQIESDSKKYDSNEIIISDEDLKPAMAYIKKAEKPIKVNQTDIVKSDMFKDSNIDDKSLKAYYNYMINNLNNENECLGTTKISNAICITEHKGKKIYGYLESLGVVMKHPTKRNKSIFVKEL